MIKTNPKSTLLAIMVTFLFILIISTHSLACSTFLLSKDQTLIIGHNLDMPYEIPGMIVINKRNILKTSIS